MSQLARTEILWVKKGFLGFLHCQLPVFYLSSSFSFICPSASCLVLTVLFHSFCFFFLGGGGGGRGVQVRVMDSLVLSFGVFCWFFVGLWGRG